MYKGKDFRKKFGENLNTGLRQSSSPGPSGSIPHSLKMLKAALSYKSWQGNCSICSNVQEARFGKRAGRRLADSTLFGRENTRSPNQTKSSEMI